MSAFDLIRPSLITIMHGWFYKMRMHKKQTCLVTNRAGAAELCQAAEQGIQQSWHQIHTWAGERGSSHCAEPQCREMQNSQRIPSLQSSWADPGTPGHSGNVFVVSSSPAATAPKPTWGHSGTPVSPMHIKKRKKIKVCGYFEAGVAIEELDTDIKVKYTFTYKSKIHISIVPKQRLMLCLILTLKSWPQQSNSWWHL